MYPSRATFRAFVVSSAVLAALANLSATASEAEIWAPTDFVVRPVSPTGLRDRISSLVAETSRGELRFVDVARVDRASGLIAIWVENREAQRAIAWIPPGMVLVVLGSVFGRDGREMTDSLAASLAGTEAASGATTLGATVDSSLYERIAKAEGITQFTGDRGTLYVFFDTECIHCRNTYRAFTDNKKEFNDTGVGLRWIPAAVLSDESLRRGAAVLKLGLKGLVDNFDKFEHRGPLGGVSDKVLLRAVSRNTEILLNSGQPLATPILAWKGKSGELKFLVGAPTGAQVTEIFNEMGR